VSQFNSIQMALADLLMALGAVQVKVEGFTLKKHEAHPDAPRSPYFLNLRDKSNPGKKGTLTPGAYELIALCWGQVVDNNVLFAVGACGLPHAATPMMKVLVRQRPQQLVLLDKREEDGRRWIAGVTDRGDLQLGAKVLIFDDVITGADSKLEAIKVLREAQMRVENVVVVVDRQQGGAEALAEHGIGTHSVFTVTELMEYYAATGQVDPSVPQLVRDYIKADAEFEAGLLSA